MLVGSIRAPEATDQRRPEIIRLRSETVLSPVDRIRPPLESEQQQVEAIQSQVAILLSPVVSIQRQVAILLSPAVSIQRQEETALRPVDFGRVPKDIVPPQNHPLKRSLDVTI